MKKAKQEIDLMPWMTSLAMILLFVMVFSGFLAFEKDEKIIDDMTNNPKVIIKHDPGCANVLNKRELERHHG